MMSEHLECLFRLRKNDIPKACSILTDAFQHYPIWNKVFEGIPHSEQRLKKITEIPLRFCLQYGEVYATSENLEGIAAWVPGKYADLTIWRLLRSGGLIPGMNIGPKLAIKMKPALLPVERDRKRTMKGKEYTYLQIIGVATAYQRQGYGRKLLHALIEKSDKAGLPIYLETETERNVVMYQRYGFEVIREIFLPVINLPIWELLRRSPDMDYV